MFVKCLWLLVYFSLRDNSLLPVLIYPFFLSANANKSHISPRATRRTGQSQYFGWSDTKMFFSATNSERSSQTFASMSNSRVFGSGHEWIGLGGKIKSITDHSVCTQDLLAEEAVRSRKDPARRNQCPGAEVRLSGVNGCHPGVSAGQSWVSTQYPSSGCQQPLLMLFPTYRFFGWLGSSGSLRTGQDVKYCDLPRRSCRKKQNQVRGFTVDEMCPLRFEMKTN